MKYLSHPDKELIEHLSNVRKIGLDAFHKKQGIKLEISNDAIEKSLSIMLYYHDIGKSTRYFQEYLQASVEAKTYSGNDALRKHALISAVYAGYKTYLAIEPDQPAMLLALIVFSAVFKHHGNFCDIKDMVSIGNPRWRDVKEQWNVLNFEAADEKKPLDFQDAKAFIDSLAFEIDDINKPLISYFLMNLFFSILTYADKNEAAFGKSTKLLGYNVSLSNIVDNYKTERFTQELNPLSQLNEARNEIYQQCQLLNTNNPILSINVPTGSGKTLTVVNFAFKLLAQNTSLHRVIYALPFTSIIDQTEEVLQDIFIASGLDPADYLSVHHHLTQASIKINEDYIVGDSAQFIIENWDSFFILTTFWQFFHTLISGKNRQLRKFHNLSNSIIILDEIQTIPYEYWFAANRILKQLARMLNCKIVLLTATMPLIFSNQDSEIHPLVEKEKLKQYFHVFSRYKLFILNRLQAMSIEALSERAIKHIQKQPYKSFLFVFNTIKSSLEFFTLIKGTFCQDELIYISSNVLPVDRKKKIEQIKEVGKRKIVVSTQIIEAGVDIDLDIVYRDFAPLDSIIQTAGRCNRNNRNIEGEVYIYKLADSNNRSFCNYIYSVVPLHSTEEILNNLTEIDEKQLMTLIETYYKKVKLKISTNESRSILECIERLEYNKISEEFKMIKEGIPDVLVFIEKDNDASIVLNQFYRVLEIKDKWKRKTHFLEIRKDFYNYTLSLKLTKKNIVGLENLKEIGNYKIITQDFLNSFYNEEIGYCNDFENFI